MRTLFFSLLAALACSTAIGHADAATQRRSTTQVEPPSARTDRRLVELALERARAHPGGNTLASIKGMQRLTLRDGTTVLVSESGNGLQGYKYYAVMAKLTPEGDDLVMHLNSRERNEVTQQLERQRRAFAKDVRTFAKVKNGDFRILHDHPAPWRFSTALAQVLAENQQARR